MQLVICSEHGYGYNGCNQELEVVIINIIITIMVYRILYLPYYFIMTFLYIIKYIYWRFSNRAQGLLTDSRNEGLVHWSGHQEIYKYVWTVSYVANGVERTGKLTEKRDVREESKYQKGQCLNVCYKRKAKKVITVKEYDSIKGLMLSYPLEVILSILLIYAIICFVIILDHFGVIN